MRTRLVIVGGFLGAGKTSLLLAAGTRLRLAGRRAGIITNDQGGELVDTRAARAAGFETEEIAGGCFCCRFSDFVKSAERLLSSGEVRPPEVILAEPVGSCTDLSATILQPIRRFYADRFELAPLTVLADPKTAEEMFAADADPLLSYLYRKQLAEADIVRFSKADRYSTFPELPGVRALPLSVHTGEGVGEWLEEVLAANVNAGARLLEIDYACYAAAEAALGWLNWHAEVRLQRPLTPAAVAGPLVDRLDRALTRGRIRIAHLKVFIESGTGHLKASICRNGEPPSVDGALDAPPASRHELVLNLRAEAAPEKLEEVLDEAAREIPGRLRVRRREAFRPSPPEPEYRLEAAAPSQSEQPQAEVA